MSSICTTKCALCVEEKDLTEPNRFDLPHLNLTLKWCVFRHDEPLARGTEIKSNGDIKGTVCYRSKIVPKGKRQRKRRTKNKCPRCGYKLN